LGHARRFHVSSGVETTIFLQAEYSTTFILKSEICSGRDSLRENAHVKRVEIRRDLSGRNAARSNNSVRSVRIKQPSPMLRRPTISSAESGQAISRREESVDDEVDPVNGP